MSHQIEEALKQFSVGIISDDNLKLVIKFLKKTIDSLYLIDAATRGAPMHTLAIRHLEQELNRAQSYLAARKEK